MSVLRHIVGAHTEKIEDWLSRTTSYPAEPSSGADWKQAGACSQQLTAGVRLRP